MHNKTLVTIPLIVLILGLVAIGIIIEPNISNNNIQGFGWNHFINYLEGDYFTGETFQLYRNANNNLTVNFDKKNTFIYKTAYFINSSDKWEEFELISNNTETGSWSTSWIKENATATLNIAYDTTATLFYCEYIDKEELIQTDKFKTLATTPRNLLLDEFNNKRYAYICGLRDVSYTSVDKNRWLIRSSCTPTGNEICDGIDNDCDGDIDEDFHLSSNESSCGTCGNVCDGICQSGTCMPIINICRDNDNDGYNNTYENICGQDCDDNNASIHPGATEICGDNIDQDCDGNDLACGTEICNGIDDDSDGSIDENVCNQDFYCDEDNDFEYSSTVTSCDNYACVSRYTNITSHSCISSPGLDCDDANININTGATEICGNNIDENCDGSDLVCSCTPTGLEICNNNLDDDCDGNIDAADTDCQCNLNCGSDNVCNPACEQNEACTADPDCCTNNNDCSGICDTTTHQCVDCPTNLVNGDECVPSCNSCASGLDCYANSWSSTGYYCQDPNCKDDNDRNNGYCENNYKHNCEQDNTYYSWNSSYCGAYKICETNGGYASCVCEYGSCTGTDEKCIFGSTGDTYRCSNGCWVKSDICAQNETCVESNYDNRIVADCEATCTPTTEICDGIDNDCDGSIDEDFNLQTDNNNCGTCGNGCDPGYECQSGTCTQTCTNDPDCSASNEHETDCRNKVILQSCKLTDGCYKWVDYTKDDQANLISTISCPTSGLIYDNYPRYLGYIFLNYKLTNQWLIGNPEPILNTEYCTNYYVKNNDEITINHINYEGEYVNGDKESDSSCDYCESNCDNVNEVTCESGKLKQCFEVATGCKRWVSTENYNNPLYNCTSAGKTDVDCRDETHNTDKNIFLCIQYEGETNPKWRTMDDVKYDFIPCTNFDYPNGDLWGHFRHDATISTPDNQRYILNQWAEDDANCDNIRSSYGLS